MDATIKEFLKAEIAAGNINPLEVAEASETFVFTPEMQVEALKGLKQVWEEVKSSHRKQIIKNLNAITRK